MLEIGQDCLYIGVKLQPQTPCLIEYNPQSPSGHQGYAQPVKITHITQNFALIQPENMASAATSTNTSQNTRSPEDDIAAIAKQISDHAEAIYQTWKSRGLAPQDILTCHTNENAADRFGNVLTPQRPMSPESSKVTAQRFLTQTLESRQKIAQTNQKTAIHDPRQKIVQNPIESRQKLALLSPNSPKITPQIELLAQAPNMDNNHLERLVSNFVTEDKARLAASKNKPNFLTEKPTFVSEPPKFLQEDTDKQIEERLVSNFVAEDKARLSRNKPSSIQYALQKFEKNSDKPKIQAQKPQISPKPRFPPAETIEYTLPQEITPLSWPLKNRLVNKEVVSEKSATLDEVALEEKR